MPRALQPSTVTAITAAVATRVFLIEFAFSGGTVRWTTAPVNLSWNGFTWTAVGGALNIGEVSESADPTSGGLNLTLSGVDLSAVGLILTNNPRGRTANVYLAFVTGAGTITTTPLLYFSGFMNTPFGVTEQRPARQGEPASVQISTRLVPRLVELQRLRMVACDELTHSRFADYDTFFRPVGALAGRQILWGRSPTPGVGILPSNGGYVPGYGIGVGSSGRGYQPVYTGDAAT